MLVRGIKKEKNSNGIKIKNDLIEIAALPRHTFVHRSNNSNG